jgi:hypothetical protein
MTLVEAIVASLVALVIAGIVYTVFVMQDRQLRESGAMSKLQRECENVRQQIAADVRCSKYVLLSGEAIPNPAYAASNGAKSIDIYYDANTPRRAYSFSGGKIYRDGTAFVAGKSEVTVDDAKCGFDLPPLRNQMTVMLALKTTTVDTTIVLSTRKDAFRCRQ